ncbi:MAG TPA: 6-bladed beta-propeller [Gemmatimonadales bacterium]|nr:6-bladed beta-propeller [Gemmatimonadales bacterium]
MRAPRIGPGWLVLVYAAACVSGAPDPAAGAAGLATAIDSSGDSVIARVSGAVPSGAVRRLTEELRIAPGVDDTTLFTDIGDYDVDASGRLWVYDRPSKSIFLFDAGGTLLRHIGRDGAGPGEFRQINGAVVRPDGGIAVWDSQNSRVSFFDSTGSFVTSRPTPSGFSTNNGLISDRSGSLFLKRPVTAPRPGEILGRMGLVRLKPEGGLGDSLVPPDLDVPRDTYVATSPDKSGTSSTASRFAPGYLWAWHPDGYFVIANGGTYDITLVRAGLKPLLIRRAAEPVSIAAEERDEEHARIEYQMRRTDPGWSWSGPPIPRAKAPLSDLRIARDGRLWVQVAAPSERISDAELSPPRDPKAPVNHFRSTVVYEVFSPQGTFLGRIDFPGRSRFIEADGDLVWAIVRDENDLPALVRFRITPGLH